MSYNLAIIEFSREVMLVPTSMTLHVRMLMWGDLVTSQAFSDVERKLGEFYGRFWLRNLKLWWIGKFFDGR